MACDKEYGRILLMLETRPDLAYPIPIMIGKLPFVGRIFWKVLAAAVVLVVLGWNVGCWIADYKTESQDYGGLVICTILLAYLIHLWLLPQEELAGDDESAPDEEDERQAK